MHPSRYQAPRYTHSFYAPEPLFTAYEEAIEIKRDLDGFEYDSIRGVYVKKLTMMLKPITYIYLTQVILHNNRGRISSIDGQANLSGLARSTTLNSGRAGDDPITVNYSMRMKRNQPLVSYRARNKHDAPAKAPDGSDESETETVDIIGGRLMTFGICGLRANSVTRADEVLDRTHHYMDITMQFNNGIDSTFVFDVTNQVQARFKGGVITVELDVDTISIPSRSGGSGFEAVVKEYEEETHEFEM